MKKTRGNWSTFIAVFIMALIFSANYLEAAEVYTTTDDGLALAMIADTTSPPGTVVGPFGFTGMGMAVDNFTGDLYTIADSGLGPTGPRPTEQLALVDPLTGVTTRIGQPFSSWLPMNTALPAIEIGNDGIAYVGGVDGSFYKVNLATGEPTLVNAASLPVIMDYAFDSNGNLYAIAGVNNDLYTVDPVTGVSTLVARLTGVTNIGSGIMGIWFDENDILYGHNLAPVSDSHLYRIDINTGTAVDLGLLGLDYPHGGDMYVPAPAAQIYTTTDDGLTLGIIDPVTANGTAIGPFGFTGMGMAVDNFTGDLYTIADSGLGPTGPRPAEQLAKVDPLTGATTRIGQPFSSWLPMNTALPAIEIGNDGIAYVGGVDGSFYKVNLATGEPTLVNAASLPVIMDYAFDSNGNLYAIAGVNNDLYTVDPVTGVSTLVARLTGVTNIGSGIMGIWFDKNDILYGHNLAPVSDSHLYRIDINTGTAVDLGLLGLDYPHGGDSYISIGQKGCITPPGSIISWWPGDNNANDIVGIENGTPVNGVAFSAGLIGAAFSLDGIDDYIDLGTSNLFNFNNGTGDFTIETWINVNTISQDGSIIVGKGAQNPFSGWSFHLYPDGSLAFGGNGAWELISAPGLITAGTWTHVAVTKSGNAYTLYVNGVVNNSFNGVDLETSLQPLTIGSSFVGLDELGNSVDLRFDGLVDDLVIYSRALSSLEIAAIKIAGSDGKCQGSCTDSDNDGYSIEGGICGVVDCNDNNPLINPGAADFTCNGIDENCSGTADEGYTTTSTSCGVGICGAVGENICQNGQVIDTCTPGQPLTEGPIGQPSCSDGADNDCDGFIDSADSSCQLVDPDLLISSFSSPNGSRPGTNKTFTDTVVNNGTGTAGASTVRIYISLDNILDAGDTELGSRSVPPLLPGASSTGSTLVTIPNFNIGMYSLIVAADADNSVSETSEANNIFTKDFMLGPGPDLVVSILSTPASADSGSSITIGDTTRNNKKDTTVASTTRFYISLDNILDAGDTELGSRSVPALAKGVSSSGNTAVIIPPGTASGQYYIISKADGYNTVLEVIENNNENSNIIDISLVCTDNDNDTYSIEGGICGAVDCNDNDASINPGAADSTCNGIDENCSGIADEGYITTSTSCGVGICGAVGENTCQNGQVIDTCTPGQPLTEGPVGDATCSDGLDNNCDGLTDASDISCQILEPDLTITNLIVPPESSPGLNITISDTTGNIGVDPAGASETRYYLSTDLTYDGSDIDLGFRSVPGISAGSSDSGSILAVIPAGTSVGQYYILASADSNNSILETNEGNNLSGTVINIVTLCTDNDNDTYSIEGGLCGAVDCNDNDASINPGAADFTCNGIDENCSGTADEGYISTPTVCGIGICGAVGENTCQNGQVIDTCTPGQPLTEGPGGSPTCSDNLDNDCDGLVDINDNSCDILLPDLFVSNIISPAGARAGTSKTITDTVANTGNGNAGPFTVRIYFSTDTMFDGGDIELGSRAVLSLANGASSSGSTSVTIPNLQIGTYYILVIADADNSVAEADEINNIADKEMLIGPGPDLIISNISAPAGTSAGSSIVVTDTTLNTKQATSIVSTTTIYLSADPLYDAGDIILGSRTVPGLAKGASSIGNTSVSIPAGTLGGTYYLIVQADSGNTVLETREYNNESSSTINITP